jgi:hypothetical protein
MNTPPNNSDKWTKTSQSGTSEPNIANGMFNTQWTVFSMISYSFEYILFTPPGE